MSEPIAIIPKNSMDEIRVMWSEYKGHRYLDIRVYTEAEGKADKVPTKKGVTLRPDLIPELWRCSGVDQGGSARMTHGFGSGPPSPVFSISSSNRRMWLS